MRQERSYACLEGDFLRAARRNARAPGEKRRPLPWPIDCRSIGCSAYVSAGIAGCADSTGLVLQILRGSVIIPSLTKSVRDWYIGNTSASQAEVAGSTPVSRSKTKRTSGRMSFLFWVPPPTGRLHPSVSECSGSAKPPLRQGFGLRPKRLYAAKAARPIRAIGWYFCEQGLS